MRVVKDARCGCWRVTIGNSQIVSQTVSSFMHGEYAASSRRRIRHGRAAKRARVVLKPGKEGASCCARSEIGDARRNLHEHGEIDARAFSIFTDAKAHGVSGAAAYLPHVARRGRGQIRVTQITSNNGARRARSAGG